MKLLLLISFIFFSSSINGQSCDELIKYLQEEQYGTTYTSINSTAISKVTFYSVLENFSQYYFAVVCFKAGSYSCKSYVYQVGANTKTNYSLSYLNGAGAAFWKYIQPYHEVLDCGPDFKQ
tara:strand:- start:10559 stop:10921 length:363 start_codon:yes stop_codon:yes gene_type:complete